MIAHLERGRLRKAFNDVDHAFTVEHTGDIVGNGGRCFAFSNGREITKEGESQFATDGRESVAIKNRNGARL